MAPIFNSTSYPLLAKQLRTQLGQSSGFLILEFVNLSYFPRREHRTAYNT